MALKTTPTGSNLTLEQATLQSVEEINRTTPSWKKLERKNVITVELADYCQATNHIWIWMSFTPMLQLSRIARYERRGIQLILTFLIKYLSDSRVTPSNVCIERLLHM